jgi:hypothetical protein
MMTISMFDKIISLIITKLFFSITNEPIEKSSSPVALFAEELPNLTEHQKKQVKHFVL